MLQLHFNIRIEAKILLCSPIDVLPNLFNQSLCYAQDYVHILQLQNLLQIFRRILHVCRVDSKIFLEELMSVLSNLNPLYILH